ncbi:GxxExxY protein [Candidatus Acetothermia bacterium]|nr:GxxExxY protein [Candidatus Acetothermia bacterium]
MNRQDAKIEPRFEIDEWARLVIGAAIEVHKHLGPGYLESVYEEALAMEFNLRSVPFERQKPINVTYKGQPVGESRLDFLVDGCLIVELKAVEAFAPVHQAQVISYLKAMNLQLGLLINFNVPILKDGIKRVVLT